MAKDTKDRILATALDMFSGNTAQSAFGASWNICVLILLLFLEIHKVILRKTVCIRTQIFSESALAALCGIALSDTNGLRDRPLPGKAKTGTSVRLVSEENSRGRGPGYL